MIVISLSEIISLIIIAILIVAFIIYSIISVIIMTYKEKSRKWHNCYECKYWDLYSVPGCGDGGTFICRNKNSSIYNEHIWRPSTNDRTLYKKCDKFEQEK